MSTSHLDITLPETWQVVDPHDPYIEVWEQLDEPLPQMMRSIMRSKEKVEFAAGLLAGLADDEGNLSELLIASLTAASYDTDTMPEAARTESSAALVNGIPFGEQQVSLLTLTIPVTSDDGRTTVLLNFATPNLPRAAEFDRSFRDIAATAVVHNNG